MSRYLKFFAILSSVLIHFQVVSAQGYYEVRSEVIERKDVVGKKMKLLQVALKTTTGTPFISFAFPGKNTKQLHDAVLGYVKTLTTAYPYYYKLQIDDHVSGISYRCFETVGMHDSCFADIYALTYMNVIPSNDTLYVQVSPVSQLYATAFHAQLQITSTDAVASVNDVPFNFYSFIQPSMVLQEGGQAIWSRKTIPMRLAYPESIYDPEGNIVNAYNKQVIERFYDHHLVALKKYLDKNLD